MKNGKLNIKAMVLIILILVLIDSTAFIMTEGFGKNLVINIVFDILDILVTAWVVTDHGIFKKKK